MGFMVTRIGGSPTSIRPTSSVALAEDPRAAARPSSWAPARPRSRSVRTWSVRSQHHEDAPASRRSSRRRSLPPTEPGRRTGPPHIRAGGAATTLRAPRAVGRGALGPRPPADGRPALADRRCLPGAVADAGLELDDIDGLSTYPGPAGMGMSEGGVTAVEEALRLQPTWINGGGDLPGPGGSVIAAMLAVASGLCRHVLASGPSGSRRTPPSGLGGGGGGRAPGPRRGACRSGPCPLRIGSP